MNNSEYASKEEVIECIYQAAYELYDSDYWRRIVRAIRELAAADVRENVHGKWVKTMRVIKMDGADYYDPVWFCPACGQEYDATFASHNVKYCYRCGAEMKGEQDA